ncbi:hypothetical protein BDQ12DRAFT_701677 [Crucibulum laeve]|uniref:Galactose oxidase n=1 Tax=Crucibulum laeve TaxID=68775 RepID=A0A5C3MI36_9AGAR|nr:hypothetical protein BDQ12DRAFT_701677 [Crucibulum laeve]
MAGCNGVAQCLLKQGNVEVALTWLEEIHILYLNAKLGQSKPMFDWIKWIPDSTEFVRQYVKALAAASDIYLSLGNTGSAVHRRWTANECVSYKHRTSEIQKVLNTSKTNEIIQLRHPDPKLCANLEVKEPELQLLGSWKKIKVKKAEGPGRRMTFSSFIWKGKLYIAGGRKDSLGPFYRDMFALDLEKLDSWRSMPSYSQPMHQSGAFLGWHIIPCREHSRAYLFTGCKTLDFFDLATHTWGSINTTFARNDPEDAEAGIKNWIYPKSMLTDSTQQIIDEKLYVFGGTHGSTNIGCNLFMVLDLKTREWRRLSGTVIPGPTADPFSPGPRKTPTSWVDGRGERLYLVFGECDRMGAQLQGELHGGECGHPFDDFWSWDLIGGGWRRERIGRNAPCPRSEVAYAYNPIIGKAIIWGGYNPDLPTDHLAQNQRFAFSYYADTFICDTPTFLSNPSTSEGAPKPPTTCKWRQVLTRGFPTYRAQAHPIVDPDSGKTYLFGGFTNNDYVPSRKSVISRSFGDLWELRINLEGGNFESVALDDEARTAQLGPWQRCFTCGCAGPWKKCGGTCHGHAFFCDADCLKEGWKDHREMHQCRKIA